MVEGVDGYTLLTRVNSVALLGVGIASRFCDTKVVATYGQ